MPNLKFLHTRLNLDTPEDLEIYGGLTKYPEGERSRVVRLALLAYVKAEGGCAKKGAQKTKAKQAEPIRRSQPVAPRAAPTTFPTPAAETDQPSTAAENTEQPATVNSEHPLKELLNSIQ